ncbi:GGDEF domain-containing protein [Sphingomonas sp. AOB5]|uniref:sensor domain-containing diguanylate cyclase n=1 Tax=Sphingomonas sp. AOB5 TaxID=3034017 RepID=UPI0023F7DFDA|nr:diguanylate cyclase [Sphingomonas sp. AOB5]MDF7777053.1 GGDEF domain-containing protein [Sphingomonas sp. AOB5]
MRFRLPSAFFAWLFLSFLFAALPASAQRADAGRELAVCVLRDTGGMNPAQLIQHPERFDCKTPQHKMGSGDYWVISEDIGVRSRSREPLNIRWASLWQQSVSVHALYSDGRMSTVQTGSRGIAPWIQLGAIAEVPLPRLTSKVVRVMWHVEGAASVRGIVLGARLATGEQSARSNLMMAGIYAGFGGLCLALLVYNFALWGALRHRFQLWYCLMVAGLLGYCFTSSGAFAWAFPDVSNNSRLQLNYLQIGLLSGAALMFARTFFEERIFTGWLGRATTGIAAMIAGAGVVVWAAAPFAIRVADWIFTLIFLGLATVVVPMLWRAWRLRSNYLWLFAIAWGAPIMAAVLRILGNLHVLPWSFWLDNSTILSMTAEALLSSVAIAYRIRLLSLERDRAMEGEEYARRLAETDPLTGLLNRRAFLEKAIGRPGEQVLQIADLDHFKRVNDTLGHDGGDEVLRVFARLLRNAVPTGALVARMGGEEFAILASQDERVEAETILARLRGTRMPFDVKVTASIGTCTGPLSTEPEWKALYRGADKALFEAKSAGRDRARVAQGLAAA